MSNGLCSMSSVTGTNFSSYNGYALKVNNQTFRIHDIDIRAQFPDPQIRFKTNHPDCDDIEDMLKNQKNVITMEDEYELIFVETVIIA